MKHVGDSLKAARIKLEIPLINISRLTKIKLEYLESIEIGDFSNLPPAPYVKGMIRSYSQAVGMDVSNMFALFRRDYESDNRGKIILRTLTQPILPGRTIYDPKLFVSRALLISGIGIIIIFSVLTVISLQPPTLKIVSPDYNSDVGNQITITGKTNADNQLTVAGRYVKIQDDGIFSMEVYLESGKQTVVVVAKNKKGRQTIVEHKLNVITNP